MHSTMVWLLLAAVLFTWWTARARRPRHEIVASVEVLLWAIVAQGLLGYVQYAAGVPEPLVLAHVFGATLVWTLVVRLWLVTRRHERAEHGVGGPVAVAVEAR